jgi:MFS family permease
LTDHQYQTAITVTYVPYIAAELPSNLVLKKIGPRIVLPFLCTTWGIVTTLQSLVHNYEGLLACRFFLGLMEGGLFPGIVLYLSGKSSLASRYPQTDRPQVSTDATNSKFV